MDERREAAAAISLHTCRRVIDNFYASRQKPNLFLAKGRIEFGSNVNNYRQSNNNNKNNTLSTCLPLFLSPSPFPSLFALHNSHSWQAEHDKFFGTGTGSGAGTAKGGWGQELGLRGQSRRQWQVESLASLLTSLDDGDIEQLLCINIALTPLSPLFSIPLSLPQSVCVATTCRDELPA